MQLIAVKSKDIPLLSQLATKAYRDHYPVLWHDEGEWYIRTMYNEEQLHQEILDKNVRYYIVYQENTPYGYIKLKLDYPLSIGEAGLPFGYGEGGSVELNNALYIERIYFIKEGVGKGLGHACFHIIERYAKTLGKNAIWLMAMDKSPATQFYIKQGFSICGTWHLDFEIMKEMYRGMLIFYKKI